MSDTVIKVENLSKLYQLGEIGTGTLSHDLNRWFARIRGKEDPFSKLGQVNDRTEKSSKGEYVWALKDLKFEVNQGEVLGIIGRNGAGKSTLLKVLSRITAPTSGTVQIKGRVGSLLEVGTGFHHEMTGKENIYLNGTILGMTRREIKTKLDEIVDFAGVSKYVDTPVKRYSSGMMVRLGFAVAAFLETEILIVDEVLAVGDAEFQKKATGKIKDISSGEGKTVLFVSHNMQSITTLTSRCFVMDKGQGIFLGDTQSGINFYLSNKIQSQYFYQSEPDPDIPSITLAKVTTSQPENIHIHNKALEFEFHLHTPRALKGASLSFQVINQNDIPVMHLWTFDSEHEMCRTAGKYVLKCRIPKSRLYLGSYYLKAYFTGPPNTEIYQELDGVCPFRVEMYNYYREFEFVPNTCTYMEDAGWDIKKYDI